MDAENGVYTWWWQRWVDKWMRMWIETRLVGPAKWIWKLIPETRWCISEQEIRSVELGVCPMQLIHFWSSDVYPVQNLLLCTKFHRNWMIFRWDMAINQRAQWKRKISEWSSVVANPHRGRSTSEWVSDGDISIFKMVAVRHLGIVLSPYETTHEVSIAGRSCMSNYVSIWYTDLKILLFEFFAYLAWNAYRYSGPPNGFLGTLDP